MKPAVKLKRLDQQKLSTNYTTVIHGHMDMHTANLWRPYVENVDKIFHNKSHRATAAISNQFSINLKKNRLNPTITLPIPTACSLNGT